MCSHDERRRVRCFRKERRHLDLALEGRTVLTRGWVGGQYVLAVGNVEETRRNNTYKECYSIR